jgi:cytochrome c
VAAWDIDVRPDFKGLPKGQGSVNQGQDIWEAKCASCHGVFGESNSTFAPLVGGTIFSFTGNFTLRYVW